MSKKGISKEEKVIGDLTRQWEKGSVSTQRKVSISPMQASGSVALAYYRGRASEREDIIKSLRKKYPDAARYLDGF